MDSRNIEMATKQEQYKLPDICYDEPIPGHETSIFPFIFVKKGEKDPPVLFIELRHETGEVEMGSNGAPIEIVETTMHKYVDIEVLKEKLPPHLNDIVRVALGFKPLKEASESGQALLDKVMQNVQKKEDAREARKRK